MTALSPETRRLLDLSRDGDDPTPARELAVRNRLIARLGVTALGVAGASAALGAAEAGGAAGGAGAVAGSAAAKAVTAGATAVTCAKSAATLLIVGSLGAGAWMSDAATDRAVEWPAAVAGEVKRVIQRAWLVITNHVDDDAGTRAPVATVPPVRADDLHDRLVNIARRPNHPVAKEAELVLIVGAEQALATGDVDRAERYLDRHAARFGDGELRADREALRALCDRARGDTNF